MCVTVHVLVECDMEEDAELTSVLFGTKRHVLVCPYVAGTELAAVDSTVVNEIPFISKKLNAH